MFRYLTQVHSYLHESNTNMHHTRSMIRKTTCSANRLIVGSRRNLVIYAEDPDVDSYQDEIKEEKKGEYFRFATSKRVGPDQHDTLGDKLLHPIINSQTPFEKQKFCSQMVSITHLLA